MYELSMALRYAPEVFVDIPGYEGYYQVSNYGKVRSLDRVIKEKTGKTQTLKGRVLKLRINPGGYYYIGLGKNGTKATFAIHQLVAQAFIPNPYNKKTVNHLDGNKLNNSVANLEWCTYSENLEHAYKTGLRRAVKSSEVASKNYKRKLTEQQVREIKRLLARGNLTHREIAKKFSVARSTITEIKSGRRWKHLNVIPLMLKRTTSTADDMPKTA
ncbi:MAG: NUMOD4 domain-containing protein [Cyanobacteria bacterium J06631_6]